MNRDAFYLFGLWERTVGQQLKILTRALITSFPLSRGSFPSNLHCTSVAEVGISGCVRNPHVHNSLCSPYTITVTTSKPALSHEGLCCLLQVH